MALVNTEAAVTTVSRIETSQGSVDDVQQVVRHFLVIGDGLDIGKDSFIRARCCVLWKLLAMLTSAAALSFGS